MYKTILDEQRKDTRQDKWNVESWIGVFKFIQLKLELCQTTSKQGCIGKKYQ